MSYHTIREANDGPRSSVVTSRMSRAVAAATAAFIWSSTAVAQPVNLFEMSIEELSDIQISTVSRVAENRNDAPASVHVITREEIRRAGVRSIAEALRLAPGVEVARNSSSSWTISMRGFSSDLSNKLLVLIDGRSVYSPLFAGVFWDVQDTLLEDVDRIEVIAGPGGTLWGANAVNGVVNIITRSASDTQGGFVEAGSGNEQEAFGSVRIGGMLNADTAGRVYVKQFRRDSSQMLGGGNGLDSWEMAQGGFRIDGELASRDNFTLQGDIYYGESNSQLRGDFTIGTVPQEYPGLVKTGGHNILGRWTRELEQGASLRVQAWFDHTRRLIPGTYDERRNTRDLDFQHHLAPLGRHDLIWGAAVRSTSDELDNTTFAAFTPVERTDATYSLFIQDKIDLWNQRLFLTLGSKFEHNNYSRMEYQPSARLALLLSERQTLWAAVSRAVRIPARLNHDLTLLAPVAVPDLPFPLYVHVQSSDAFEPEELLATEFGYRLGLRDNLSFDVTLYLHDYERLFTQEAQGPQVITEPVPHLLLPVTQANGMEGEVYGGTFAANWQPLPGMRIEFEYSRIDFDLQLVPGSNDRNGLNVEGNSPRNQVAVRTYVELPHNLSLFTGARHVDELPNQAVPAYTAVNVSIDWKPVEQLTTSLTVRNLADPAHAEFGEDREIERSAYLTVNWTF